MKQEKLHNEIEAYLNGRLTPEEELLFKKKMDANPEMAKEVQEHKNAMEVTDVLVQDELKSRLKELQKQREVKNVFSLRKYALPLAAAIILGLLAFSWIFIRGNFSDRGLVASNFEIYSGTGVRGGSTEVDAGIKAYNSRDYPGAINYLEGISQGDPLYSTAQFYLGNIYLENDLNLKAIRAFQYVIGKDDSRFAEPSQWYISLAYLNSGNRVEARVRLEEIAGISHHAYKEKARALLAKMDSSFRNLPGI